MCVQRNLLLSNEIQIIAERTVPFKRTFLEGLGKRIADSVTAI